jgi:hypothetical protein
MDPARDFKNSPASWRAATVRLLNTLRVLKRGLAAANDVERFDSELSAMMIVGFAFENAFKARFLARGGILYADGKLTGFRDHAFVSWATEQQIAMSTAEREALDKAEFFCVAWGRYPAHSRIEKERPFETWAWSDVERVEAIVGRLLNEAAT